MLGTEVCLDPNYVHSGCRMANSEPDWNQGLPLGVLSAVAGGSNALKAMRAVSHSWQAEFEASVKSIDIDMVGPLPSFTGAFAQRFPGLTCLNLGESLMDEANLGQLKSLKRLSSLTLGGAILWRMFREHYDTIPGLEPLTERLTGSGMGGLREMPFTCLDLSGCSHLVDAGLQYLRDMPLASLSLMGCDNISESGISLLRGLPLTSLDLGCCPNVTDGALHHFQGLPQLTDVCLSSCNQITDVGLAQLHSLPLTMLCLDRCSGVTSSGIAALQQAKVVRPHYPYC